MGLINCLNCGRQLRFTTRQTEKKCKCGQMVYNNLIDKADSAVLTGFKLLTLFDWISPIVATAQTIANDPTPLQSNSWTFFIPYDEALQSGHNPNDILDMLHSKGIKTYGAQYVYPQDRYFFSVPLAQRDDAIYWMGRYGIPHRNR